jgi:Family of unknown function (DUF6230)
MSFDNRRLGRHEAPQQPRGRIRWRRFALVAVPAGVIAALLAALTAKGAIASSISVSGQEYTVTASTLSGQGFEQFGGTVNQGNGSKPVIVSAIHNAQLYNLCQSVKVGPLTLRLTAGGGGNPARANNLIVDASGQTGSVATFQNIAIGQDAGTLTEDPGTAGTSGGFGQQATSITIQNLRQQTWLTTAGTFSLPGLSIGFGGSC